METEALLYYVNSSDRTMNVLLKDDVLVDYDALRKHFIEKKLWE